MVCRGAGEQAAPGAPTATTPPRLAAAMHAAAAWCATVQKKGRGASGGAEGVGAAPTPRDTPNEPGDGSGASAPCL